MDMDNDRDNNKRKNMDDTENMSGSTNDGVMGNRSDDSGKMSDVNDLMDDTDTDDVTADLGEDTGDTLNADEEE
ncbi:hypothetical protein KW783_01935 [Candidatus Parcubacteria bacterium]|nr:hypothetical protein [Candidatus Parcubacteria bacterium]